jgi:hypothetical protein
MNRLESTALKVNGMTMPADFPVQAFESVHGRLAHFSDRRPTLHVHFAGAWNALSYRYLSLIEHGDAFTASIVVHGAAPDAQRRYQQERDLFGFFSNGFSVFESFFYGMYAIGALLDPARFPLETPADQQRVTPARTVDAYSKAFPVDRILDAFRCFVNDSAYKECREIRNVLTHRSAPGRTIFVTFEGSEAPTDEWKISNIPLDKDTVPIRRRHISRLMTAALEAARIFVSARISPEPPA